MGLSPEENGCQVHLQAESYQSEDITGSPPEAALAEPAELLIHSLWPAGGKVTVNASTGAKMAPVRDHAIHINAFSPNW